jgi:hypothetical protein
MKYRRINIQIRDGIDPADAVTRVATVMQGGRISGDHNDYYCWASTFTDDMVVITRGPGKRFKTSDSFVVYKDNDEKNN